MLVSSRTCPVFSLKSRVFISLTRNKHLYTFPDTFTYFVCCVTRRRSKRAADIQYCTNKLPLGRSSHWVLALVYLHLLISFKLWDGLQMSSTVLRCRLWDDDKGLQYLHSSKIDLYEVQDFQVFSAFQHLSLSCFKVHVKLIQQEKFWKTCKARTIISNDRRSGLSPVLTFSLTTDLGKVGSVIVKTILSITKRSPWTYEVSVENVMVNFDKNKF